MKTINIQELINESVKAERKEHGGQRHWFISRLGACPSGQYLERLGEAPDSPIDDRLLRVFHCGRVFEDWVIGLLEKQEHTTVETQVHVESDTLDVSGYADLVLTNDDTKRVYELKSQHSRSFWYMVTNGEGANLDHQIQLWMYLHLLNIPEGRITYISKDDLTIAEYPVFRNDTQLQAKVTGILDNLNQAWKTKTIPEPITDPEDYHYGYCNWHLQCLERAGIDTYYRKYAKGKYRAMTLDERRAELNKEAEMVGSN